MGASPRPPQAAAGVSGGGGGSGDTAALHLAQVIASHLLVGDPVGVVALVLDGAIAPTPCAESGVRRGPPWGAQRAAPRPGSAPRRMMSPPGWCGAQAVTSYTVGPWPGQVRPLSGAQAATGAAWAGHGRRRLAPQHTLPVNDHPAVVVEVVLLDLRPRELLCLLLNLLRRSARPQKTVQRVRNTVNIRRTWGARAVPS